MRPDPALQAAKRRALLHRLVTDRGPDTGRLVDHLKVRSGAGGANAAALLEDYEQNGAGALVTDLTGDGGGVTLVYFMLDVSALDGTDVLA